MSRLYDLAIAFAAKEPPPGNRRSTSITSWKDACGALTNQFALYVGGWDKTPSNYGATSVSTVYSASKIVSKNSALAPINAKHWFKLASGAWHVFTDLNGAGTDNLSASLRASKSNLGNGLCIQSVAGYIATGGVQYMGWSMDYAGATSKYKEPVVVPPAPVLGPTQRRTIAVKGANVRSSARIPAAGEPTNLLTPLKADLAVTMAGFELGQVVSGSPVWFRHQWGLSHSSAFVGGPDTANLPDLTPAPVPPPIVTRAVTFLSFDAVISRLTVEDGKVATAPADPEAEGYLFKGWNPAVTAPVVQDTTFVARWEKLPEPEPEPEPEPPIVTDPDDSPVTKGDLRKFIAPIIAALTVLLAGLTALFGG